MRTGVVTVERRLLIAAVLMAIGGYLGSNFVPSRFGIMLGLLGALLLACIGALLSYFSDVPERTTGDRLNAMIVFWIFHFCFGWFAVTLTIFGLYTWAFGNVTTRTDRVVRWNSFDYRGCEGAEIPNIWFRGNRICLDRSLAPKYRAGAPIILRGRATEVGMDVDGVI